MLKITNFLSALNEWSKRNKKTAVVLVVLILMIGGAIDRRINPESYPSVVAAPVTESKSSLSYEELEPERFKAPEPMMVVRPYLRHHLNDWDSYDDEGYSEPETIAEHDGQPAWRVRHQYRAKNGFNATILNDQMFYYTKDGVYLVLDAR